MVLITNLAAPNLLLILLLRVNGLPPINFLLLTDHVWRVKDGRPAYKQLPPRRSVTATSVLRRRNVTATLHSLRSNDTTQPRELQMEKEPLLTLGKVSQIYICTLSTVPSEQTRLKLED